MWQGECLEVMKNIPDKSIDLVLTDPPYGTTACKWDTIIPFEPMWDEIHRVSKNSAAILLFGKQPFVSLLVRSNLANFRYEIIWNKKVGTDFAQANNKPINVHENIEVFYRKRCTYNRWDDTGFEPYSDNRTIKQSSTLGANGCTSRTPFQNKTTRAPTSIRTVFPDNRKGKGSSLHPTQKPIELLEWLVKSYSNKSEHVLDFTMGSGSTGVAALNTNRRFIGIELDPTYCGIAKERIQDIVC